MTAVNPYLTFNGTCEEAFNLYKSVFSAEFITVSRFKDMPSDAPMSEAYSQKILHISLPVGQSVVMGSDRPESAGEGTMGDNFSMSVNVDSEEEATRMFNGLAAGGQVTMPLQKAFWNAFFGMLTDRFGVHWMINYDFK